MFREFRRRYGHLVLILIRRFVATYAKIARQRCHLYFNHRCKEYGVITKSLHVRPIIRSSKGFRLARKQSFQNLNLRISTNHDIIAQQLRCMVLLACQLVQFISEDELAMIIGHAESMAERDSASLRRHLQEKFECLREEVQRHRPIADKSSWIKNLSDRVLSADEVSVLQKGFQFAVTPKSIPIRDFVSEVEQSIFRLNDADKSLVRSDVCKILRHCRLPRSNLTKDEWLALKNLKNDSSIVVSKADKGRCTVLLNRSDYDQKLRVLLNDEETYAQIKSDPTKITEKRMNSILLKLFRQGKFQQSEYYNLRSTDAVIPRLYGLIKIHKDGFPVRPIVSFVGAATYCLSKYFVSVLSPLVGQSVKNSFEFTDNVRKLNWRPDDVMVSFDVMSLFSCVPVELVLKVA